MGDKIDTRLVAIVGAGDRVCTLCELVSIHLLHLNALRLLALDTVLRLVARFYWQVVVLSMVLLSCSASIVRLRVCLTSVRALLLNEHTFERRPRASICNHHLLCIVQHLLVVHTTRARILLLSRVKVL